MVLQVWDRERERERGRSEHRFFMKKPIAIKYCWLNENPHTSVIMSNAKTTNTSWKIYQVASVHLNEAKKCNEAILHEATRKSMHKIKIAELSYMINRDKNLH